MTWHRTVRSGFLSMSYVAGALFLSIDSGTAGELQIGQGQALYTTHCAVCHGADLEGQPNWRKRKPDGRLPAPPHDASGHTFHHSDEQLLRITKLGTEAIVGGNYKSDMPGFANLLSDDEIRAVLAYIKSKWPKHIRARRDAADGAKDQ